MFRRDYSCSLCIFSRTAILIFLITSVGLAQDGSNKRGFSPGSSFSIGDIETINTTNGNLMLRFPLGVLTEGRDGLTGGINLYYSSKRSHRRLAGKRLERSLLQCFTAEQAKRTVIRRAK